MASQQQSTQKEEKQPQQQEKIKQGIQKLTLSTPVDELEVLCELLVDVDDLKENGFGLTKTIRTQGWEGYFECLKGPIYTELGKQFCIFATTMNLQVTSYVLGHKITNSET